MVGNSQNDTGTLLFSTIIPSKMAPPLESEEQKQVRLQQEIDRILHDPDLLHALLPALIHVGLVRRGEIGRLPLEEHG